MNDNIRHIAAVAKAFFGRFYLAIKPKIHTIGSVLVWGFLTRRLIVCLKVTLKTRRAAPLKNMVWMVGIKLGEVNSILKIGKSYRGK